MKKVLFTIFSLILCIGAFAQQEQDPNRMIIHYNQWSYKAFNLEVVDSITFANVEGEIAADIELFEYSLENAFIGVTRTNGCEGFKLTVAPTLRVKNFDDATLASFIDQSSANIYYQDFERAELSGMTFEPNTDYTIATVGMDRYGVLCDVRRVEFTAPSKELIGNPGVAAEILDAQAYEFTIKFTPNADVSTYSYVSGEKGTMQQQLEMFGPMMGFSNMGQLIEGWGIAKTAESTFTWTNMNPGTTYEIFIQARDANGTMAPYQVIEVSTTQLGGDGLAEVTITLGDYTLCDWGGELLPSQFIKFTPNENVGAYRFGVYYATDYDENVELIKQDLCSEPPMPMTGWFFYEEIETDYQIDPNTECVVIAAGKNAKDEWGPITEVRFTTPAEVPAGYAPTGYIKARNVAKPASTAGRVPLIKSNQLQLIAK